MIRIDLKNGEFKIDKFVFSPLTKIDYILEYLLSQEIELWTSNQNWKSYRLRLEEFIVILFYQSEILKIIEIFPSIIENSISVSNLIIELGGESEYFWGKIELNNDIKAGYESVLIKYN